MTRPKIRPKIRSNKLARYAELARSVLIEVAQDKDEHTITYKHLVARMGGKPSVGHIGEVLDYMERSGSKIKLSALAKRVDTNKVGGGFFGLPGTPPRLLRTSRKARRNPRLSDADEAYWLQQKALVYQHYQSLRPRRRNTDDES